MTRKPLKPGTIIEYCGDEFIVISDSGGAQLKVVGRGESSAHQLYWSYDGATCTVVSQPTIMQDAELCIDALLEWIDAVPEDIALPAMPGIDRDHVESVLNTLRLLSAVEKSNA